MLVITSANCSFLAMTNIAYAYKVAASIAMKPQLVAETPLWAKVSRGSGYSCSMKWALVNFHYFTPKRT